MLSSDIRMNPSYIFILHHCRECPVSLEPYALLQFWSSYYKACALCARTCATYLWVQAPHSRMISDCSSLLCAITNNSDSTKTYIACGSRRMGHSIKSNLLITRSVIIEVCFCFVLYIITYFRHILFSSVVLDNKITIYSRVLYRRMYTKVKYNTAKNQNAFLYSKASD
jgi:hypothetical protein